jgi:peptidyl-tRNA hydrolase, PTH1 family
MKVVCGLGNPGTRYAGTRHNVGFAICDRLAAELGASFSQAKFHSDVAQARTERGRVLLLKPQTFMNKSGKAVAPALAFFKLEPADLLVVHDDADLEAGRLIVKHGGGTAGHKGLNSIRDFLGDTEYDRLRFGVGRPEDSRIELSDFVLAKIAGEDSSLFEDRYDAATRAALLWLSDGVDVAMNEINGT